MPERQHATWGELLRDAVEKPGRMLEAYTAFHNYSFGNALLALEQCVRRNLQPGPLNTYRGWLEKKRQVRKGEKGITLCMPMPFKRTTDADSTEEEPAEPQTRVCLPVSGVLVCARTNRGRRNLRCADSGL